MLSTVAAPRATPRAAPTAAPTAAPRAAPRAAPTAAVFNDFVKFEVHILVQCLIEMRDVEMWWRPVAIFLKFIYHLFYGIHWIYTPLREDPSVVFDLSPPNIWIFCRIETNTILFLSLLIDFDACMRVSCLLVSAHMRSDSATLAVFVSLTTTYVVRHRVCVLSVSRNGWCEKEIKIDGWCEKEIKIDFFLYKYQKNKF